MGYTTLAQVLKWIEKPSGISLSSRRSEAIDMANRIREHFYLMYQETPLFMDVEECIQVQAFTDAGGDYFGITLPHGMQTPEAIWRNGQPISMFSRWREYRVGVKSNCTSFVDSFDKGDGWSTERDLSESDFITLKAEDPEDCGKVVQVGYTDPEGKLFSESITLGRQAVINEREVGQIARNGGVLLPTDLRGQVVLSTKAGRVLAIFTPDQHVPSYRRLKLTGVCDDDQVLVKAARRYVPLYDDLDVVETDNRLAFEEAARYFYFIESTASNRAFLEKAEFHNQKSKAYLLGEKSRTEGKAAVKQLRIGGEKIKQSHLSRRR